MKEMEQPVFFMQVGVNIDSEGNLTQSIKHTQ